MNVLIIGNSKDKERFQEKFNGNHNIVQTEDVADSFRPDVVFWFDVEDEPDRLELLDYGVPVFVSATHTTLYDIDTLYGPVEFPLFGFCGYPTFLEREVMEVSMLRESDSDLLSRVMNKLGTEYEVVADRIGLVTPRTLFMIFNEAYFTVMEGIASKSDIDKAMKLGTNYPYGPFEWVEKIGLLNVFIVLESLQLQTGDARYRVCELMKRELLLS